MVYYFNFGENHNKKCKGQNVGVSEVLEVLKQATDTCEVLGRTEVKTVALIDPNDPKKGISVMYGGGDRCTNGDNPVENGKPRRSRFQLVCASRQDDNVNLYLLSLWSISLAELKELPNVPWNLRLIHLLAAQEVDLDINQVLY